MGEMTGLNRTAFEQFLPSFGAAHQTVHSVPGQRKQVPKGGRKANLGTLTEKHEL
jgi:hypothetical protein